MLSSVPSPPSINAITDGVLTWKGYALLAWDGHDVHHPILDIGEFDAISHGSLDVMDLVKGPLSG
jgi:hypothetical protein